MKAMLFSGVGLAIGLCVAGQAADPSPCPELEVDAAPVEATFEQEGDIQCYRLLATPGQDVRVICDLAPWQPTHARPGGSRGPGVAPAGGGGSFVDDLVEIYVAEGYVPTPTTFDVCSPLPWTPDPSVQFAVVSTNDYFVTLVARHVRGGQRDYTLQAVGLLFGVRSVLPTQVGNAGEVTLQLAGSLLTPGTVYRLVHPGGEQRLALRQHALDSGTAFATFDLKGFPAGLAGVEAELSGNRVQTPGLVEVIAGGAAEFYGSLAVPRQVRPRRPIECRITYGNRGLIDVPLPLLHLRAPTAVRITGVDHQWEWGTDVAFLGLASPALLPSLGPKQERSCTLVVWPGSASPVQIRLEMTSGEAMAQDSTAIGWSELPRPSGVADEVWADHLDEHRQQLGATLAEFHAVLIRELGVLAAANPFVESVANFNGVWLLGPPREEWLTPYPVIEGTNINAATRSRAQVRTATSQPPAPGDGVRRTHFVVISDADYTERYPDGRKNIPAAEVDHDTLQEYILVDLRVPPRQTVFMRDRIGHNSDTMTPTLVLDGIRSLKHDIDADDELVIFYSGHGLRGNGSLPSLLLNGGELSPVDLENVVNELKPARFYFINDSCFSEGFNSLVEPEHAEYVGIAATKSDRRAFGGAKSGGQLNQRLIRYLREGRTLQNAFDVVELDLYFKYNDREPELRQEPVLHNPGQLDLKYRLWRDAGGEEQLARILADPQRRLAYEAYVRQVASRDPNDKVGPAGWGPSDCVAPGSSLVYEIHFENAPTAEAPAQEILVSDWLPDDLDWSSLQFDSIGFNDVVLRIPPGRQHYAATARVGSDPNPVSVEADLDPVTGILTWNLRSYDPGTGGLPDDPLAGFLPPNDSTHCGEGTLRFAVKPRSDLAHGTALVNWAEIVFDPTEGANPPIETPAVTNRVDAQAPTSRMLTPNGDVSSVFKLVWEGDDGEPGSGVAAYCVLVARDGGVYESWLAGSDRTEAWFQGELDAHYAFCTVAVDALGNQEAPPAVPDVSVHVVTLTPVIASVSRQDGQLELRCEQLMPEGRYVLERASVMPAPGWLAVSEFVADGAARQLAVAWDPQAVVHFFRLRFDSP